MSWVLLYNSATSGRYNGFCHGYLCGVSHFISFVIVSNDIMMIIIHHAFFYDRELARRRKESWNNSNRLEGLPWNQILWGGGSLASPGTRSTTGRAFLIEAGQPSSHTCHLPFTILSVFFKWPKIMLNTPSSSSQWMIQCNHFWAYDPTHGARG